jgi:hypothetical protein
VVKRGRWLPGKKEKGQIGFNNLLINKKYFLFHIILTMATNLGFIVKTFQKKKE